MMEAAEPWYGDNFAAGACILRCHTACRSLLVQAEMSPVFMVITDVLIHEALQMAFIENDHMVEQVAAAVTYPTFGDTVLPRTSETGSFRLDVEALHCIDHLRVKTGRIHSHRIQIVACFLRLP